jgi:hypothetical protein
VQRIRQKCPEDGGAYSSQQAARLQVLVISSWFSANS